MIKECPVLLANEFVTVVCFGDIKVQLPHIDTYAKTVRVANENGKFFIVDETYSENNEVDESKQKRKRTAKKTTIENITEADDNPEETSSCDINELELAH